MAVSAWSAFWDLWCDRRTGVLCPALSIWPTWATGARAYPNLQRCETEQV